MLYKEGKMTFFYKLGNTEFVNSCWRSEWKKLFREKTTKKLKSVVNLST